MVRPLRVTVPSVADAPGWYDAARPAAPASCSVRLSAALACVNWTIDWPGWAGSGVSVTDGRTYSSSRSSDSGIRGQMRHDAPRLPERRRELVLFRRREKKDQNHRKV